MCVEALINLGASLNFKTMMILLRFNNTPIELIPEEIESVINAGNSLIRVITPSGEYLGYCLKWK